MRIRYEQLDALKCWAILWVVLGHLADYRSGSGLFQSVFLFAYSWHMPLFIFLSGLFDRPRDEFPIRKVTFYIALGFLYKLVNYIVGFMLGYRSFWLLGDSGAPWFMFAMAAWASLAWLLRRLPFLPILAVSFATSLAVGYDTTIGDYLYLSRIVTLFPVYWIAFNLTPEFVVKAVHRRWLFIVAAVVLAGWGIGCLICAETIQHLRPMLTWRNSYASLEMGGGMLWRVVAYVLSGILLFAHLGVFCNIKLPSFVASIGSQTLSVYFWHEPAKSVVFASGLYDAFFYVGPVGKFALLAIGALMCWLFSRNIFMRPLERVRAAIDRAVDDKVL